MSRRLTLACLVAGLAACGGEGRIQSMSTAQPAPQTEPDANTAPSAPNAPPAPIGGGVSSASPSDSPGFPSAGAPTPGVTAPVAQPLGAGTPPVAGAPDAQLPGVAFCAGVTTWDAQAVAIEDEVLQRVNQARAKGATCAGVPFGPAGPLVNDSFLRCSSRVHAWDMATNDYFAHNDQTGHSPGDRIHAAGGTPNSWGENIAEGQPSAQSVVDAFMGDYGHCANIMNPSFTTMGNGYFVSRSGAAYWVEDFGS